MKTSRTLLFTLASICLMFLLGCSDSGGSKKTTDKRGTLSVTVTDSESGAVLADVRVLVFDANTNLPVGNALTTDSQGVATDKFDPGTYSLKLSKQNYESSPARDVSALPHNVTTGQTTETNVAMISTGNTSAGSISGNVADAAGPVAGVLVVATNTGDAVAFSSVTDGTGNYIIYNAPAATYNVKAWLTEYNSDEVPATVVQATETVDVDITLTTGASGTVSGAVTFLATDNGEVDVALIHPITGDVIPGTSTHTASMLYSISGVPDGTFIARASFENDTYIMDPDAIVKFGEPTVTVAANTIDRPFDVTGAVTLSTPTNLAADTTPAEVSTLTPTFTWVAYASSSDYVVEVINASGKVIWGGFSDGGGALPIKNYTVPSSELSAVFNIDANASEPLVDGETYRWRVYASKDAGGNSGDWNLISASEDQMGIFKVVLPVAP